MLSDGIRRGVLVDVEVGVGHELDKQMERDNARMAELLELMADPDFYINEDASSDAIAEHAQLKKRIAAAEEEWFVLNEELEAEMEKQKAQA